MKRLVVIGCATLGLVIAVVGSVLYQVGPCGATGPLAHSRIAGVLWWVSLPGQVVGLPLKSIGIPMEWASCIGGAVVWGVAGLVVVGIVGKRTQRDTSSPRPDNPS